jgi:D-amino peptidase
MSKKVNVFISFDMEGISVVSSWREMKKDSGSYEMIRKCATDEINAAVRGIRRSGENIGEILVCDSHARGDNLLVDRLEQKVSVVKGTPRNYYMVEGLDESFDVVFFIGYHAMAGTERAGMDHTYSSSIIYNVAINGRYVGETEINAAMAGYYKVPVGLVTGDDLLIKEVRNFFGRYVETVVSKYGISRYAAKCRHFLEVQEEITKKAQKALQQRRRLKPFSFRKPLKAEFEVADSAIADVVVSIPGLKRLTARKLKFRARDVLEFYRILRLICSITVT